MLCVCPIGFTLCKENLETLEAISYMAAALGILPSDFTYAGIKDKRAITYQSMVVKKVSPQRYFCVPFMDLVGLQNCFSLLKTMKVKPILKDVKDS